MEHILGEKVLAESVDLLVRLVEAAGALVIFVGAALAAAKSVLVAVRDRRTRGFVGVRLGLGRFLALGWNFS